MKKLNLKALELKMRGIRLLTKKNKGDQAILVVLGLCVVGVFLLFIFKDAAGNMVTGLTNSVNTKIQSIFTGM